MKLQGFTGSGPRMGLTIMLLIAQLATFSYQAQVKNFCIRVRRGRILIAQAL